MVRWTSENCGAPSVSGFLPSVKNWTGFVPPTDSDVRLTTPEPSTPPPGFLVWRKMPLVLGTVFVENAPAPDAAPSDVSKEIVEEAPVLGVTFIATASKPRVKDCAEAPPACSEWPAELKETSVSVSRRNSRPGAPPDWGS